MLVKVANHHNRGPDFYTKIFRVLRLFIEDIKKYQNSRIFNIFKDNKRILIFLIEEKILTVDEYFVKQIKKRNIHNILHQNEKWFPKYEKMEEENTNEWVEEEKNKNEWVEDLYKELPDNFIALRKIGENDSYISKLIRKDLVEDFIIYVNKNCISRNSTINL